MKLSNLFPRFRAALRPATYDGKTPKARNTDEREGPAMTKKGAIHKHKPTFKSRRIKAVTPAQYRRLHMGLVIMTPNYKLKHAAPKWRNRRDRWTLL